MIMATISGVPRSGVGAHHPVLFSKIRTTIETAFLRNNVHTLESLEEAYYIAAASSGTIAIDFPIYKAEELGLPKDAKVLLFNDGQVTGRTVAARHIITSGDTDIDFYAGLLREAIFESRDYSMYHSSVCIGLHTDFMVKAHLLVPKGFENNLYSWLLNFQYFNQDFQSLYTQSKTIDEGDIYVYSDPYWKHEKFPHGLVLFDPQHNCVALLGMRYFGEFKKSTLTLAWTIADRINYIPCHGGQKRYNLENGERYIASFFGLSGSGKSTITHARHDNKYDITVLHDDAFIISCQDASSISLEPSYFDKTQDYPPDSPDNKYLLTLQNCGATKDDKGLIVPVTEDIRNGNGRAVKSLFLSNNRAYKFEERCNAIFWIMKDDSLPPLMKITSPVLAATLGVTLATKRSNAENISKDVDINKLIIEPYANPFRVYPLIHDYLNFKSLFKNKGIDCYVLNTGFFLELKIPPKVTLALIEQIIEGTAKFETFANVPDIEYIPIRNYIPDFGNPSYIELLVQRIQGRIEYLSALNDYNKLPHEASGSLYRVIGQFISSLN